MELHGRARVSEVTTHQIIVGKDKGPGGGRKGK